ncbi:hypothetical protein BHU09_06240 [Tannerella sp. oral taxon 808]|nr:hypothetical protein BHU09_06240 [Tannerella sp. oral taxon 808]
MLWLLRQLLGLSQRRLLLPLPPDEQLLLRLGRRQSRQPPRLLLAFHHLPQLVRWAVWRWLRLLTLHNLPQQLVRQRHPLLIEPQQPQLKLRPHSRRHLQQPLLAQLVQLRWQQHTLFLTQLIQLLRRRKQPILLAELIGLRRRKQPLITQLI